MGEKFRAISEMSSNWVGLSKECSIASYDLFPVDVSMLSGDMNIFFRFDGDGVEFEGLDDGEFFSERKEKSTSGGSSKTGSVIGSGAVEMELELVSASSSPILRLSFFRLST
jgi:hypothetical protein